MNVFRLSVEHLPFVDVAKLLRSLGFVEQTTNDRIDLGDDNAWRWQSTDTSLSTTIRRESMLRARQRNNGKLLETYRKGSIDRCAAHGGGLVDLISRIRST